MHESGELYPSAAAGGRRIFRRKFSPRAGEVRGGMLMLHGWGDHLGCHVVAAEMFCGQGWVAAGVDWPGHGFSEGRRGQVAGGVAGLLDLVGEALAWLKDAVGEDLPLGLYAHSTGGLLALRFLTQQGMVGDSTLFDRVWLSSPLLRPRHGQHWLKIAGARLVARWFPEAILDTGVRPAKCRHVDAAKAKAAGDYDLCHHFISVSMGAELLAAGDRLADAAPPLGDPVRVLITQGLEDGICPPAFSHAFFEKIPARDKLYVPLPGLRHETLREPGNELLIEAVEAWLGA